MRRREYLLVCLSATYSARILQVLFFILEILDTLELSTFKVPEDPQFFLIQIQLVFFMINTLGLPCD
ncbi:MAG: hypothetical protein EA399_06565 [Desulfovibrionales bacterium]|nr:MAG: hypothetical protein EA399_06565 [Desulfovibrionales bacterium]